MSIRHRLLGLAFASGDLLLELTPEGVVSLALGAGPAPGITLADFQAQALEPRLVARPGRQVLDELRALVPGSRMSCEILMDCGHGQARRATLSGFALPDLAPNLSCSVRYEGPAFALANDGPPPALIDADAFLDKARKALSTGDSPGLSVDFIAVPGLSASGERAASATTRIETALQAVSLNGASASRLGADQYAVLRDASVMSNIVEEVGELLRDEELALDVTSSRAQLSETSTVNALLALRFAIQSCLNNQADGSPAEAFQTALTRTVREADEFRAMVRSRDFTLHYQPIVALDSGAVHHFEALARLRDGSSPAVKIQMAEELDIIQGFDLAVAQKAVQRLRQQGSGLLRIAINVSGASLASDVYAQELLSMTADAPDDRRRLIIEVTESAALADLEAANRRLGALRRAGMKLCIDDLGAGAASLDYVHGLSVDTVKIDGKFIQGLEKDRRAQTVIGHLVKLCASLNLSTIAEYVETQACADILRELGVNYGQGWLFGKAEAEPRTVIATPSRARRRGAVESWG